MERIQTLVKSSGLDVNIEIDTTTTTHATGQLIRHFDNQKMIKLFTKNAEKKKIKIEKAYNLSFTKEQFLFIVTAHELGHAFDTLLTEEKRKMDASLHSALRCAITEQNLEKTKFFYRQYARFLLRIEHRAWRHAKQFLSHDIHPRVFRAVKQHSLTTYKKGIQTRFRLLHMVSSFSKQKERILPFFPDNIRFSFSLHLENTPSYYDEENNVFYIHMKNMSNEKHPSFQRMSSFHYMVYQVVYDYLESIYGGLSYNTFCSSLYDSATRDNAEDFFSHARALEDEQLHIQLRIFEKMATVFKDTSSFKSYRKMSLQLTQSTLTNEKIKASYIMRKRLDKKVI